MTPKSGVLFQKVRQKVTHLYKYQGFWGNSPNKKHENGLWTQNAYLAEDTMRNFQYEF